jgi:hypothetical protein
MIDDFICKMRLLKMLRVLRHRQASPKAINLTHHADLYFAAVTDSEDHVFLDPSGGYAAALTPNRALLKSLVEYMERRAYFSDGTTPGHPLATAGIDGTASFPLVFISRKAAIRRARDNAIAEATERFVWATWWDSSDIRAEIERITRSDLTARFPRSTKLLREINAMTPFQRVIIVRPSFIGPVGVDVFIFFLLLDSGGLVCASSAGVPDDREETAFRAAVELFRHSHAVKEMLNQTQAPTSLYEKRLEYFGSGRGNSVFEQRLAATGTRCLELPSLVMDQEAPHSQADILYIHRCLFHNQPEFLSGPVSRLCI